MFGFSGQRYSPLALFFIALFFICLAPVFWLRVELPQGAVGPAFFKNTDPYERVYPYLNLGFSRLASGELPLWNPYQHGGVPFQADPNTGLFQPLNSVFLFLPTEQAMALSAFLCLFLMGFFFAVFLRSLSLRYLSCVFGAVAYAFSGSAAAAMSRPELAAVLVWAPLFFWAARELLRTQRGVLLLPGSVAGAGMLLSGGYGITAALLLLWLPFALGCVWQERPQGERVLPSRVGYLVTLVVLAFGLSAVQWLPAFAWSRTLADPGVLWSVDLPADMPRGLRALLWQVLSGRSEVVPRAIYPGLGALLVIPAAFFHRQVRLVSACFGGMGAVALAMMLTPARQLLELPETAWLFMLVFCLAALAGIGTDRLFTVSRDPRSPFVWIPVLLLLLLAVLTLLAGSAQVRGLVLIYLVLMLPFFLLRARWLASLTAFGLTIFLYVDCCLGSVNYSRHPFAHGPAIPSELAQVLREAEEHAVGQRLFYWGAAEPVGVPANLGMLARLPMAGGTSIALDERQWRWTTLLDPMAEPAGGAILPAWPGALNHFSARVLLVGEDRKFGFTAIENAGIQLRLVRARNQLRVYENASALPRAYWTPQWRRSANLDESLGLLRASDAPPGAICIIEGNEVDLASLGAVVKALPSTPDPSAAAPANEGTPTVHAAVLVESAPERVVVQVEAPEAGVLVLADAFAPGWHARVDESPAPILIANGMFRAVPVPAGPHLITFEYSPRPFWVGVWISLGTVALMLVVAVGAVVRGKK